MTDTIITVESDDSGLSKMVLQIRYDTATVDFLRILLGMLRLQTHCEASINDAVLELADEINNADD